MPHSMCVAADPDRHAEVRRVHAVTSAQRVPLTAPPPPCTVNGEQFRSRTFTRTTRSSFHGSQRQPVHPQEGGPTPDRSLYTMDSSLRVESHCVGRA